MGDNRTVRLLGNLVWALQACKAVKAPPDAGVPGMRQASSSTISVPTRPPPAAPGAPHAKVEGRTAPAVTIGSREAHTHHRAKHDSSVAVGLHMLLTEGPRHVGIRLQEELCELLANQVVAAVPQEPAGSVAGHQDLRSQRGGHPRHQQLLWLPDSRGEGSEEVVRGQPSDLSFPPRPAAVELPAEPPQIIRHLNRVETRMTTSQCSNGTETETTHPSPAEMHTPRREDQAGETGMHAPRPARLTVSALCTQTCMMQMHLIQTLNVQAYFS